MALPNLATDADLTARGIDTSDATLIAALLASASAAVRDAAGVPITLTTATVTLNTVPGRRLRLPAVPVRSVAAVLLDGVAITDWKLRGNSLWRACRWQKPCDIPAEVTVTFTAGLDEVPADIVDMVCNLVGAGVAHAADGYEANTGKESEAIDDYRVAYAQGPDAPVSPMELPEGTKESLAARFGGGAAVVVTRS
ncbi:hypothetical protein [Micromonospora deserti]|uniref:Uncharacterized protein n=1 Tax=Micromonospora deserti TaxID=2070366 RepID=A0A2W2DMA1_9ACTN|nr:hypothetical protein [Micromonospora deserti]PZF98256.1 hypothetical protein C1I99_13805 [Micromonospora deserti]